MPAAPADFGADGTDGFAVATFAGPARRFPRDDRLARIVVAPLGRPGPGEPPSGLPPFAH